MTCSLLKSGSSGAVGSGCHYIPDCIVLIPVGCRESSLLLEQRVHNESDQRQRSQNPANYVPCSLSQLQDSLEQVRPLCTL